MGRNGRHDTGDAMETLTTPNAVETARWILNRREVSLDMALTLCRAYLWSESQRKKLEDEIARLRKDIDRIDSICAGARVRARMGGQSV